MIWVKAFTPHYQRKIGNKIIVEGGKKYINKFYFQFHLFETIFIIFLSTRRSNKNLNKWKYKLIYVFFECYENTTNFRSKKWYDLTTYG